MKAWLTRLPVAALVALVLAAGAPAVAAKDLPEVSAPTAAAPATLYFHLAAGTDFPINTQVPDPARTMEQSSGVAAPTLTCVPNPPSGGAPFQAYNTWRGYSSPAYVEYGFTQGGMPRVWPERQMGYNGSLAGGAPVLHWFLATAGGPGAHDAPVVVPNVVVQAEMRSSEGATSLMDTGDAGPLLLSGSSRPALLAMDASQGVNHTMAGGRHVYEFTVPLAVARPALGGAGFVLRVDARVDSSACPDADHAAMPSVVEPFMDPDHRPRIELAAADPLRIVGLSPRFVNGSVAVRGLATSLWGNYDVDEGNLTLSVEGTAGRHPLLPSNVTLLSHAHGHHADPLEADWTLPDHLPDGLYWLDWTVGNDQHTALATAHAAFRLGPDIAYDAPEGGGLPDVALPEPAMPAGPLVPLALALAGGLASMRRKRP